MPDFKQTFAQNDASIIAALGDDALLDGQPVRGLFDAPWLQQQLGGLNTSIQEPQFTGRSVDLSAAANGSVLRVNGSDYEVMPPIEPDGSGMTTLYLRPVS